MVRRYTKLGYTILVQDESTFALGGNRARYGWHKGGDTTAPVILSRDTKHVFGVLGEGRFHFMFYDENSDTFLDFLGRVRKRFGPVLIFADNASWHKSK